VNSCFSPLGLERSISNSSMLNAASVLIRSARSQDLHYLTEVLTDSFHPPDGWMYWTHPLLKLGIYEDLRSRLRSYSPSYVCLVASLIIPQSPGQEIVVGTAEITVRSPFSWQTIQDQYPYISNLAVSPSYRRKGIARKLLFSCEQTALKWGFPDIGLHVLDNNIQAKQLYFSSGYKVHRIESSLSGWLFKRPRRLLLKKQIVNP
jgi:ribosomal protein S18 acetylase RimI-like enzyme